MDPYTLVGWQDGTGPTTYPGLLNMDNAIKANRDELIKLRVELSVDTIAELESLSGVDDGAIVQVAGYYAASTEGGGLFRRRASSSATRDGGLVFTSADGGRFERILANGAPLSAKGFGARGDNATNDYTPLFAAITAAASTKRPLVIEPGTYHVAGGGSQWGIFEFVGTSGLTIFGYGATLKNTDPGVNKATLWIYDSSDIKIHGLKIDGNKAAITATTEFRHGFTIASSKNVYLQDCVAILCKGDGYNFYGNAGTEVICENVQMLRCISDGNHRQGLTLAGIKGGVFYGCTFINTAGTLPSDGIDFEPDYSWATNSDLEFYSCNISGNAGQGVSLGNSLGSNTPLNQRIKFFGGRITSNGGNGAYFNACSDIEFHGVEIDSNTERGAYLDWGNAYDVKFFGGSIRNNLLDVGFAIRVNGALNIGRVLLSGVRITGNGANTTAANRYGVHLSTPGGAGATIDDVQVHGCVIGNAVGETIQNSGLALDDASGTGTIRRIALTGNNFSGNTGAAVVTATAQAEKDTRIERLNRGYTGSGDTIQATQTLDFPSIPAQTIQALTMTVTGAATGDSVSLAAPSTLEAGLVASGFVSAANTVTVRVANITAGAVNPASATWRATVTKQ